MRSKLLVRALVVGMALPFAAAAAAVGEPKPSPVPGTATTVANDPEGCAMVQAAWRAVSAYHGGQRDGHDVLRVVYFYPSDGQPLSRYAERLDGVMRDISAFYRDGLRRFGIENNGLPLEFKDGRLVVHLVRARKPAGEYHFGSESETVAEVSEALKGTIDTDKEHVVVLYGLSRQEVDGRYTSDGPYVGGGSHVSGMAHAADFELLDRGLLRETKRTLTHNQDGNPHFVQTLAEFNSWYIGGVAHELGHALGLQHDFGHPTERPFGVSLMGAGNRMYRQEIWGDGKPAFISRVSALQLLSHPFFTRSNRGRWDDVKMAFERLNCSAEDGVLQIRGKVTGAVPAYAVVAFVWPVAGDEHFAQTYPGLVNGGEFSLQIGPLQAQTYAMRLVSLHVNGASPWQQYDIGFNFAGDPDAIELNAAFIVSCAEVAVGRAADNARMLVADDAIDRAPTVEARRKLRVLREILEPPANVDLKTCREERVYVSDAIWREGKVGWGEPARNHYWFDQSCPSLLLKLGGEFFAKGIYAHAPSRFVFDLDGKWKRLTAKVGLQDGANADQASAIFILRGDGRELYHSARLRVGAREAVAVDVTGVKVLEMVTDSGWEENYFSWAIWVDPVVER